MSGRIQNPHTFDIPTIYLPNEDVNPDEIPNNIGENSLSHDLQINVCMTHCTPLTCLLLL